MCLPHAFRLVWVFSIFILQKMLKNKLWLTTYQDRLNELAFVSNLPNGFENAHDFCRKHTISIAAGPAIITRAIWSFRFRSENAPFSAPFHSENALLPRQARDKHRESTQERGCFITAPNALLWWLVRGELSLHGALVRVAATHTHTLNRAAVSWLSCLFVASTRAPAVFSMALYMSRQLFPNRQ